MERDESLYQETRQEAAPGRIALGRRSVGGRGRGGRLAFRAGRNPAIDLGPRSANACCRVLDDDHRPRNGRARRSRVERTAVAWAQKVHALDTIDPVALARHFKCEACGAWFTVWASSELENLGCPSCDADA